MKKINLIVLGFFVGLNLNAQEPNLENVDKLDILDKQSKEFFKAITGLEKDYLEEQISSIKTKKDADSNPAQINQNLNQANKNVVQLPEVSQEDYEKNVFTDYTSCGCSCACTMYTRQLHRRIRSLPFQEWGGICWRP